MVNVLEHAASPASSAGEVWPLLAVATLVRRELVRFVRQPNRVFGAVGQPLVFWVLFGAGLGPSFRPQGVAARLSYAEYFFPGTLVLIVLFTSIFTSISIIEDRREGFLQSVLVAPAPRWSMVLGKVLGGALIGMFEAMIMLVLGFLLPIHLSPWGALPAACLLAVVATALSALGFTLAWRTDSTQGFHAVMSVLLFPMWLLSGAFFPAESGWLGWVVRLNPLTYGVAGLRRMLYLGRSDAPLSAALPGAATCWIVTLAFAAVALAAAWRIAQERTAADLL